MRRTILRAAIAVVAVVVAAMFGAAPGPAGARPPELRPALERLKPLVGQWEIRGRMLVGPGQFADARGSSRIVPAVSGQCLEERYVLDVGETRWNVVVWRAYDSFQDRWRVAFMDDQLGLLDIYEGAWTDSGLVVSNAGTNTFFRAGDAVFHSTHRLHDFSDDAFRLEWRASVDRGAHWFPGGTLTYTRTRGSARP